MDWRDRKLQELAGKRCVGGLDLGAVSDLTAFVLLFKDDEGTYDLLPFFWSANGITSVFASILGMVLSMGLGITEAHAIGVCAYLLAVLVLAGARRTARAAEGMQAAVRSRA